MNLAQLPELPVTDRDLDLLDILEKAFEYSMGIVTEHL